MKQATLFSRWDAKLSEQSKTNLLRVREQLLSIHEVLVKKPIVEFTPTPEIASRSVLSTGERHSQRRIWFRYESHR